MIRKTKILTPERLNKELDFYISSGATIVDAILTYAHVNNIDIESIAGIVKKSASLRERLRDEGEKSFLIKIDKGE